MVRHIVSKLSKQTLTYSYRSSCINVDRSSAWNQIRQLNLSGCHKCTWVATNERIGMRSDKKFTKLDNSRDDMAGHECEAWWDADDVRTALSLASDTLSRHFIMYIACLVTAFQSVLCSHSSSSCGWGHPGRRLRTASLPSHCTRCTRPWSLSKHLRSGFQVIVRWHSYWSDCRLWFVESMLSTIFWPQMTVPMDHCEAPSYVRNPL